MEQALYNGETKRLLAALSDGVRQNLNAIYVERLTVTGIEFSEAEARLG